MGLTRRRLLRAGGLGGSLLLGGAALGRTTAAASDPAGGGAPGHASLEEELESLGVQTGSGYGHGPMPPDDLDEAAVDALTFPPARESLARDGVHEHELAVTEQPHRLAAGVTVDAWAYAGRVPGPHLRAVVGDRLRLTMDNRTERPHNLHAHGGHDPQMDGWEPIPGGESFTYELEARPAGLHPYHCHVPPLAEHVRRGLYGALIVDPEQPREPATEVVLVLSGFDVTGDGTNDLYAFNGVCGLYDRFPIRVPVGGLVRAYVVNMVEGETAASFHLHAETFDVYRSGTSATPQEHTDTVTLSQGERAVLELRLPTRGRYMFHPHQHHMVGRGAMGWFTAV